MTDMYNFIMIIFRACPISKWRKLSKVCVLTCQYDQSMPVTCQYDQRCDVFNKRETFPIHKQ